MKKRPIRTPLELLEQRRHLSASYFEGCSCAACRGAAPAPQPAAAPTSVANYDGDEARAFAAAARLAEAVIAGSPRMGPLPATTTDGVTAQGLVGGAASTARQPAGALTGKVVFTVGGHGFTAFRSVNATTGAVTEGWHTQRPEVAGTEMVEDLGNQDQMTFYVDHLFNAGATVVPLRPVGYQPNEILLDNDSPGVTFTGSWSNSTSTVFYGSAGDVPYRYSAVSPTQSATAKYTPNIAVAGFYPVYTWVKDDTDRIDQLYRVAHSGGVSEVRVDHSRVGKGYVYLGTYHFDTGTAGYVEISNAGANPTGNKVVIADHVRFGNGMGDIDRGWGVSGHTRSDESALFWIEHQRGQGVPISAYRSVDSDGLPALSDDDANVSAPPRWAAHMNREVAETNNEIFLSFHSNAGGGGARGDLGLYNGNNNIATKTPLQFEWASLVGKELNDDMVLLAAAGRLEHSWSHRSNPTLDRSDIEFGEINNLYINNEFDATILEVAYHDNLMDAALMRDPKFRDWAARAALQATIKYFNQYGGSAIATQPPESPTNVRAVTQANGDVTVSWSAPAASPGGGDAASGYVVYTSANGYGFNGGVAVAGGATNSYTIPKALLSTASHFFRVSATNAGGESMPSEVVAARRTTGTQSSVLIVNGFDRLARTQNPTQTAPLTTGGAIATFERVRPRFSNSFDYVVQAAKALEAFAYPLGVDSTSNEAIIAGQVDLSKYRAVIWLSGEESTADRTFDADEQALVTSYLNAGGRLFVSGSEIGWDLDAQANGVGFYNNQLRANYVADDAGTYTASGSAIFSGVGPITFDNGTHGTYDVDFPDKLATILNSSVNMVYTGAGSGVAGVHYTDPATGSRVVNLGFPFETIVGAASRNAVMNAVATYFGLEQGTIGGVTWQDLNDNGVRDAGEGVVAGATVSLARKTGPNSYAGVATATSDAAGRFAFAGLAPDTYRIIFASATNHAHLGDGTDFALAGGAMLMDRDVPLFPTVLNGTAAGDRYYVRANAARTRIEISVGDAPLATPTFSARRQFVYDMQFQLGGGDDVLTVDYTNGVPSGQYVTYYGDANGTPAGDRLRLIGTNTADNIMLTDSHYRVNPAGSFNQASGMYGVEQVVIDAGAGDDVLELPAAVAAAVTFNGQTSATADSINLLGGTRTFASDLGANTTNLQLNVASGTTAVFAASQRLHGLSLNGGSASVTPGGGKVIVTKSLHVASTSRLDLADNDLVIDYPSGGAGSPMANVFPWVVTGYNGGDWLGRGIGTGAAGASGLRGLAIAESAAAFGIAGGETAMFGSQTVDATAVLIKYTYGGDTNLDGKLDADDYGTIDFNVLVPGASGYYNGDFNFDGKIDADDYGVIDFNILAQTTPL